MSAPKSISVIRSYRHEPEACARALELLLEKPVNKAAELAPEPDDYEKLANKERRPA